MRVEVIRAVLYTKKELALDNYTLSLRHVDGRNYATAQKVVIESVNIDIPSKGILSQREPPAREDAEATNYYKNQAAYAADKTVDGQSSTRWATDDNVSPVTITYDLGQAETFNYLVIKEASSFTGRVASYRVEAEVNGGWTQLASGGVVGSSLGIELPGDDSAEAADHIRDVRIGGVTLSEVELYDSYYDTKETTAQSVADSLTVYEPALGAEQMMTSVVPEGYETALTGDKRAGNRALDGSVVYAGRRYRSIAYVVQ